jgi:hypothetical protein
MHDAYDSLSVWRCQVNRAVENKSEGEILAAVQALRNFRLDPETLRAVVGGCRPACGDASDDADAELSRITCRNASEMTGNRPPVRTWWQITQASNCEVIQRMVWLRWTWRTARREVNFSLATPR